MGTSFPSVKDTTNGRSPTGHQGEDFFGTSSIGSGRERIPKGFRNKAQGCEGVARDELSWVKVGGVSQPQRPTGLWPRCADVAVGHNPFRVVIGRTHDPRVARSSQQIGRA